MDSSTYSWFSLTHAWIVALISVHIGPSISRASKGLFALVAHGASLEIVLSTTAASAGADPPQDVECATVSGSLPRSSETAPAEDPSPLEAALVRLESLVTGATLWPAAVDVWQRFRAPAPEAVVADAGGVSGIVQPPEHTALNRPRDEEMRVEDASQAVGDVDLKRLKFRFSVVRDGRHPFGSVEASPRLGAAVSSVHNGWTVDLKVTTVPRMVLGDQSIKKTGVLGASTDLLPHCWCAT